MQNLNEMQSEAQPLVTASVRLDANLQKRLMRVHRLIYLILLIAGAAMVIAYILLDVLAAEEIVAQSDWYNILLWLGALMFAVGCEARGYGACQRVFLLRRSFFHSHDARNGVRRGCKFSVFGLRENQRKQKVFPALSESGERVSRRKNPALPRGLRAAAQTFAPAEKKINKGKRMRRAAESRAAHFSQVRQWAKKKMQAYACTPVNKRKNPTRRRIADGPFGTTYRVCWWGRQNSNL